MPLKPLKRPWKKWVPRLRSSDLALISGQQTPAMQGFFIDKKKALLSRTFGCGLSQESGLVSTLVESSLLTPA
jgi:hypothetical protein